MPLCCIGGVCIPYTAVLPLLIYGIQWLLQKMAAAGFLPETVCNYVKGMISLPAPNEKKSSSSDTRSCCESNISSNVRRGKQTKHSLLEIASSLSGSSCSGASIPVTNDVISFVEVIESNEKWEQLLTENPSLTVICKFTAEWCKPCKGIQPLYESLAASDRSVKFVMLDVDVLENVAATYRIVSLPTIMAIRDGRVMNKYSGSDQDAIRQFVAKVSSMRAAS